MQTCIEQLDGDIHLAGDVTEHQMPVYGGEDITSPIGYVQHIFERWRSWFI